MECPWILCLYEAFRRPLVWFLKRQKRGAYTSIGAHPLGFTAALTLTPELLERMPAAALVVFFVLLFVLFGTDCHV